MSGFGYWDHDAYFDSSLITFGGAQIGRTLPVWKVPIPIIASMGDLANGTPAASCDGVNEDPNAPTLHDPNFESDETYVVVGFIDAAFYDTDIGANPPEAAEHNVCDSYGVGYGFLQGRQPHGFNIGGVATQCNVVKGTSHCTNDVLSSVLAFQDVSTPAGRLYAAGVSH
jgi:hypothetical protein